jgi:ABC-type transport system involved in cytochrome bd biosynthesis fused ATPase/permease subunit
MIALLRKYPTISLVLFLIILLILAWLFPPLGLLLGVIFLLFTLVIASFTIVRKHEEAYHRGEISRIVFIRNVILEILGILFTMAFASLLAKYLAEIATKQIYNDFIKFMAGLCLGLFVGLAVGVFIQRVLKKVVWLFLRRASA